MLLRPRFLFFKVTIHVRALAKFVISSWAYAHNPLILHDLRSGCVVARAIN
jgi:hypothetical protein